MMWLCGGQRSKMEKWSEMMRLEGQTECGSAGEPHEGIRLLWPVQFYLSLLILPFSLFPPLATSTCSILSASPYFYRVAHVQNLSRRPQHSQSKYPHFSKLNWTKKKVVWDNCFGSVWLLNLIRRVWKFSWPLINMKIVETNFAPFASPKKDEKEWK